MNKLYLSTFKISVNINRPFAEGSSLFLLLTSYKTTDQKCSNEKSSSSISCVSRWLKGQYLLWWYDWLDNKDSRMTNVYFYFVTTVLTLIFCLNVFLIQFVIFRCYPPLKMGSSSFGVCSDLKYFESLELFCLTYPVMISLIV